MTLAATLSDLLARVQPGQHLDTTLGRGLHVKVGRVLSTGRRVISVSRSADTLPSYQEVQVVARDAGWPDAKISGPVLSTFGPRHFLIHEPEAAQQGRLM